MEQPSKKLSRRDAIKLIGAAAGASVLATLPTKWTKPEITTAVLPAHAQTSWPYSFASCGPNLTVGGAGGPSSVTFSPFAVIAPAAAGVQLQLAILNNNGTTLIVDPSGTYTTNGSGSVLLSNAGTAILITFGTYITFKWSFVGSPGTQGCTFNILY